MSSLKFSSRINRLLRQDAPEDLGKPTRPFIEAAIQAGSIDEARQWLDYYLAEQAAVFCRILRYFFEAGSLENPELSGISPSQIHQNIP